MDQSKEGSAEFLEALIIHGSTKKQGSAFLEKLYDILNDTQYEEYISWCADGKSILIKKVEDFSQIILPKFYKHNNFQSFVRQLNMYNFTKTSHDANRREFKQPLFRKGKRNLLPLISRKTQKTVRSIDSTQTENSSHSFADCTSTNFFSGGNPLCRSQSIDGRYSTVSVPAQGNEPLWEVVQELQTRVKALESQLLSVTTVHNCDIVDARIENVIHKNSNSNDTTSFDKLSPKTIPSSLQKSYSCTVYEFAHSNEPKENNVNDRTRSMSHGSYELLHLAPLVKEESQSPRSKRGVDAILSAAEILHEDEALTSPLASPRKIKKNVLADVRQQNNKVNEVGQIDAIKSEDASMQPVSLLEAAIVMENSLKRLQAAGSEDNSISTKDSRYLSDSDSSSPLYFQGKEYENKYESSSLGTPNI